jgi:hypothetical protein
MFLLGLLFIYGLYIIGLFFSFIILLIVKLQLFLINIFNNIETHLMKTSKSRSNSGKSVSKGNSGGKGTGKGPGGSGGGPNLDSIAKGGKHRTKEEIKAAQDELKKIKPQNLDESDKEYEKRIAMLERSRESKKKHREKINEKHKLYNEKNRENINEKNKKYRVENNDEINKRRRERYDKEPEHRQSRLDTSFGRYHVQLSQQEKDKIVEKK